MSRLGTCALAIGLLALTGGGYAQSPIAQRGRQLYETNCGLCHQQSVHSRTTRVARSIGDIREYVRRWSGVAGLRWSNEDIEEVTLYLNERYYRFIPSYQRG